MWCLNQVGGILAHPCMGPSVNMLLVQPGAAAFVQQAVGIARALPSARPAGVELSTFVAWHRGAAAMVAALSVALLQSHHAAVGSSSSSGRNGTSGAAPPEAALRRELQAAAWEVVDLVPHMARVLQVLSAERADVDDLASVCQNYAAAVSLLGMQGVTLAGIRSGSELAAWAAAADSAARLLPLLAQLNAGWQGLPEEAAFLLAKFLLLSLTTGSSYLAYAWVNSGVVTRGTAACSGQPPVATSPSSCAGCTRAAVPWRTGFGWKATTHSCQAASMLSCAASCWRQSTG